MLKLIISLCATTLFFGTAQADYVTTLNFTSPSTTSSTATITAGGTVDFEVSLFWEDVASPTPDGNPMFFNTTGGINTPISSCTGIVDCQEDEIYNFTSPAFLGTGYDADNLVWQTVPGQDLYDYQGGVADLTGGTSSYSLTYPNPGIYTIATLAGGNDEETLTGIYCITNFVNGVATAPLDCDGGAVGDIQLPAAFDSGSLTVDVLPAPVVPEPSYRISLAALLGVLFVVWRRAQSTRARRPS